jgi:hypothetical protein
MIPKSGILLSNAFVHVSSSEQSLVSRSLTLANDSGMTLNVREGSWRQPTRESAQLPHWKVLEHRKGFVKEVSQHQRSLDVTFASAWNDTGLEKGLQG